MIARLPAGPQPRISDDSVCIECKRRGNVCVMVAHGTPCLGPVTHAGCGALCPTYDRGCYGCFGPMRPPNTISLSSLLDSLGMTGAELARLFRTFNAAAPLRERERRLRGEEADHERPARRGDTTEIEVETLARVEGEGAMHVRCATARSPTCSCGSTSRRASSRRFLRGRGHTEAPDITARICGICPSPTR